MNGGVDNEIWFLALYKGSNHFFEYIVSAGAGVRVDSLGGVSRACSGRKRVMKLGPVELRQVSPAQLEARCSF